MPNATLRANARTLPEATSRRAILGAVLDAGALAAVPANSVAASLGMEPELHALIAAWHEAHRRLEQTYDASWAASERAHCPVPQALIATESDASQWYHAVVGKAYSEHDVTSLRRWLPLSLREPSPYNIIPSADFDDRGREIIASWDSWQAEQEAAKEREGVAEANALWSQAIKDYHAIGSQVAKLRAKTMAGVIAKLVTRFIDGLIERDSEEPRT